MWVNQGDYLKTEGGTDGHDAQAGQVPKKPKRPRKGNATRGNYVAFGEYGLQPLEPGKSSPRRSRPAAWSASQSVKGVEALHPNLPHKSVTSIPAETRMGKGKGEVEYWAAVAKPGTVLYEIGGVSEELARATLARVSHKLPVACRFVTRRPTL